MKALITFLILFACLKLKAQSNVITGNISSFGISGRTNITMQLSIISPKSRLINGIMVSSDAIQTISDQNGNFNFTNILWGSYRLTAMDSSGSYCNPVVLTNTVGTWQVASLCTNSASLLPIKWTFDSTQVTFDQQ